MRYRIRDRRHSLQCFHDEVELLLSKIVQSSHRFMSTKEESYGSAVAIRIITTETDSKRRRESILKHVCIKVLVHVVGVRQSVCKTVISID